MSLIFLPLLVFSCSGQGQDNSTDNTLTPDPQASVPQVIEFNFVGRWDSLDYDGNFDRKGWVEIQEFDHEKKIYTFRYFHADNLIGEVGNNAPSVKNGFFQVSEENGRTVYVGILGRKVIPGDFTINTSDWTIDLSIVEASSLLKYMNNAISILPSDFPEPLALGTFQRKP